MSSFIEKLKKRGVNAGGGGQEGAGAAAGASSPQDAGAIAVDVDIQQSMVDVVIIAPLSGVDLADVQITVEGEGDVVIVQGERKKPDILTAKGDSMKAGETTMFISHENAWGPFYRRIVLPVEIEPSLARATLGRGLLTLTLPLKKAAHKGTGTPVSVTEASM
ncbi:MAG: Hsp20 family protein [bacterium]|nr:Hsp20 family protein [bacterium]